MREAGVLRGIRHRLGRCMLRQREVLAVVTRIYWAKMGWLLGHLLHRILLLDSILHSVRMVLRELLLDMTVGWIAIILAVVLAAVRHVRPSDAVTSNPSTSRISGLILGRSPGGSWSRLPRARQMWRCTSHFRIRIYRDRDH